MADSPEAIKKSIRTYLLVMGALFVGTVITYLVATLPALDFGGHGFDAADCVIGLLIATVKATLVAAIFMHLNHERGLIYKTLLFTMIFFAAMMFLFCLAYLDPIKDSFFKP
jgi:cytochrome c oxidase subunit 4